MYCGSCMKDNTLATALNRLGHDAVLIPTYTPIRTDEEDVSQGQVYFGGINVYLQQKSRLFRYTPWWFDRLLNLRGLLRWVSRFAHRTKYEDLGTLTISMLQGRDGNQRKELRKLIRYLKEDLKPDVVMLTNMLLSGIVGPVREELGVPVYVLLQGDDIFLEALLPHHRQRVLELIAKNSRAVSGYLVTCHYYAEFMASYMQLPPEQMHVVYPGINLKGHGGTRPPREQPPYSIGYFARICPEKGFHILADAFRILHQMRGAPPTKLRISGWLGENNRKFLDDEKDKLRKAGCLDHVEHVECPKQTDKVRFLQEIDVLSVPTTYREPKGLYLLEAWANGVPVVQPAHGSFPELIDATGGGVLVEPGNPQALAEGIRQLLEDTARRREMGERGCAAVLERFSAERMAESTMLVIQRQG